jgi:hypothetical protein
MLARAPIVQPQPVVLNWTSQGAPASTPRQHRFLGEADDTDVNVTESMDPAGVIVFDVSDVILYVSIATMYLTYLDGTTDHANADIDAKRRK